MDIYSNLRRNIILEGNIYSVKELFSGFITEDLSNTEIDNPQFYDIESQTLKLGSLCADETKRNQKPNLSYNGAQYTTYCALLQLSNNLTSNLQNNFHKDYSYV